jgi:hypothetical protein
VKDEDMDTLVTTNEMVTFLALVTILGLFAAMVRYSWRIGAGAMAGQGAARFHEVVRRLGIDFARADDEFTLRGAAVGVRRCLTCREQEACDAWPADPGNKGTAGPSERAVLRDQSQR